MTNLQAANGTIEAKNVFLIENDVPLPAVQFRTATGVAAVLKQMAPGQSFFYATSELAMVQQRISAAGRTIGLRLKDGRKYAVRRVEGGIRAWRLC